MVKVDLTGTSAFFDPAELDFAAAAAAHRMLGDKSGAGSEFTGWLELPERIRDGELKAILSAAQRIRSRSKALVVIGIGGSYLGARRSEGSAHIRWSSQHRHKRSGARRIRLCRPRMLL